MPFLSLHELEEKEIVPGFKGQFVHSDNMTFAYWDIEIGAVLPEHSHPHEQVATVISGEFEITVNGETEALRPGSVAIIPPDAVHSGRAVTVCRIIDAFYPVREDYR
ncbi:MAG: cupin domain-containing protein [Proteobacteria bacterium]|nr:cupin domain-containing protein [Pseudomonadota bacterium]